MVVIAAILGDDERLSLGGLAGGGERRGVLLVARLLRPRHLIHGLLRLEERHVRLGRCAQHHLLHKHKQDSADSGGDTCCTLTHKTIQTLGAALAPNHTQDDTDSEGNLCFTITQKTIQVLKGIPHYTITHKIVQNLGRVICCTITHKTIQTEGSNKHDPLYKHTQDDTD